MSIYYVKINLTFCKRHLLFLTLWGSIFYNCIRLKKKYKFFTKINIYVLKYKVTKNWGNNFNIQCMHAENLPHACIQHVSCQKKYKSNFRELYYPSYKSYWATMINYVFYVPVIIKDNVTKLIFFLWTPFLSIVPSSLIVAKANCFFVHLSTLFIHFLAERTTS